jgi:hypothetical protein
MALASKATRSGFKSQWKHMTEKQKTKNLLTDGPILNTHIEIILSRFNFNLRVNELLYFTNDNIFFKGDDSIIRMPRFIYNKNKKVVFELPIPEGTKYEC